MPVSIEIFIMVYLIGFGVQAMLGGEIPQSPLMGIFHHGIQGCSFECWLTRSRGSFITNLIGFQLLKSKFPPWPSSPIEAYSYFRSFAADSCGGYQQCAC